MTFYLAYIFRSPNINKKSRLLLKGSVLALSLAFAASAGAHEIAAKKGNAKQAAFDIVKR